MAAPKTFLAVLVQVFPGLRVQGGSNKYVRTMHKSTVTFLCVLFVIGLNISEEVELEINFLVTNSRVTMS